MEMALEVKPFEVNMFGEITYVVWDSSSRECAIIDAGMSNDAERADVDAYIASNGLTVKYLLNTHVHLDHAFGVGHVKDMYNVKLSASPLDAPLARGIEQQAMMFHLPIKVSNVTIDNELHQGDVLKLGEYEIQVLEVPGHTPGGLAFYIPQSKVVFTGDSLFHSSIGRTDLPGGSYEALIRSVTDRLLALPTDTTIYPGHGPASTIGHERAFNPYL